MKVLKRGMRRMNEGERGMRKMNIRRTYFYHEEHMRETSTNYDLIRAICILDIDSDKLTAIRDILTHDLALLYTGVDRLPEITEK
jgi:hypothetical protein